MVSVCPGLVNPGCAAASILNYLLNKYTFPPLREYAPQKRHCCTLALLLKPFQKHQNVSILKPEELIQQLLVVCVTALRMDGRPFCIQQMSNLTMCYLYHYWIKADFMQLFATGITLRLHSKPQCVAKDTVFPKPGLFSISL